MSFDMNNDYSLAGPGAKRRAKQETRNDVKPVKRLRLDNVERHKPRKPAKEVPQTMSGRNLRQKIIQLTLQIGSFGEIVDRLEREQYGPASKVLVSNIRDHTLTALRVIMAECLITEKQLARYRADAKEAQRRRFRRDE
jgi:hypothetical protein